MQHPIHRLSQPHSHHLAKILLPLEQSCILNLGRSETLYHMGTSTARPTDTPPESRRRAADNVDLLGFLTLQ